MQLTEGFGLDFSLPALPLAQPRVRNPHSEPFLIRFLNSAAHAVHTTQRAGIAWANRHPKTIVAAMFALLLGGTGLSYGVAHLPDDTQDLVVRNISESVTPKSLTSENPVDSLQTLRLYRSDTTRSTDTAETLLKRLGVFDPQAAEFLRQETQVQQNLLGHAGRNITAEASASNTLLKLQGRWSPDDDGMFKRLTVERTPAGFVSRLETLPMTASSRLASGLIASSLFAATDAARVPDAVALQMAEIFSGDIDFQRALRKGDRFTVVYETLEGDGEPLRAGRVLSTEFVNDGKSFQAMWFQEPNSPGAASTSGASHSLTKGGYYTLAGESLHRAFLASPLQFSRITSGFQMRFHPILKIWTAHLGIDYAAATGTPVRSVGDGVVEFAGVQTGFGNIVIVQHANHYETVYGHLSRINVRQGQPVKQGDTVGLVGATGWATGPHLHFEFRVNGVHRDPTTIARKSEQQPIAAAYRGLFNQAAAQVRAQFAAATQGPSRAGDIE